MANDISADATLDDIPDFVKADFGANSVSITISSEFYPLHALYGAAYVFIARAYVFLEQPDDSSYRVTLAVKTPSKGEDEEQTRAILRQLVGEFANELLGCAWRHQITRDNRVLIETVTMQAIAGSMGPPSLDDLASFDFTDEALDDPLGIALSWEEKYGKKNKQGAGD